MQYCLTFLHLSFSHFSSGRESAFGFIGPSSPHGTASGTSGADHPGVCRGHDNKVVAKRLRVSPVTVCKWRGRFVRERLDGLYDQPRPGTPRRITDVQIEEVIVRTREETPHGATHWSTRGMAKASGLGRTTISEIWRAFRLQPHRTETFKLSKDPLLIQKLRDIVGLHLHPPEHAAVFCVDEKSQIQALDCRRRRCAPRSSTST
jgi:transposase